MSGAAPSGAASLDCVDIQIKVDVWRGVCALSGDLQQGIFLHSVETGDEIHLNEQVEARLWPAFSPRGHLAVGDYQGRVEIWNPETGELERPLPKESTRWVQNVAFSPDGRFLAGCHRTSGNQHRGRHLLQRAVRRRLASA